MSTSASVGMLNPDGSVTSIYNHSDGYLGHLGVMLRDHYRTPEAVEELMNHGDASFIGPTLEDSVFYHRDRMESRSSTGARLYLDIDEWRDRAYHAYMYIYIEGVWYVYRDSSRYKKV